MIGLTEKDADFVLSFLREVRRLCSNSLNGIERKNEVITEMMNTFPEAVDDSMRKSYKEAMAFYETAKKQRDEFIGKIDRCMQLLLAGSCIQETGK